MKLRTLPPLLAHLALTVHASAINVADEAPITASSLFSSAASQLIDLYIPSSASSYILSAASAAHAIPTGTTVPPHDIIQSALTATLTPFWLINVPERYRTNIDALDTQLSRLSSAASRGSIMGAPQVVTTTAKGGSETVKTIPAPATATAKATGSVSSSQGSSTGTGTPSRSGSSATQKTLKTAVSSSSKQEPTRTVTVSVQTPTSNAAGPVNTADSSSSSSSGYAACATRVPRALAGLGAGLGIAVLL